MPAFAVRVWLPDRPGALGAVASRIGAVRADVVGIDIIERGAGRAVDELIIDLPDSTLVDLMVAEISEVEGVDVEDIRALEGMPRDPAVVALEIASELFERRDSADLFDAAVQGARRLLGADWAAVIDPAGGRVVASSGDSVPSEGWLCAFALGAVTDGVPVELGEVAIANVGDGTTSLAVGRGHLPLRGRERSVLEAVAALL